MAWPCQPAPPAPQTRPLPCSLQYSAFLASCCTPSSREQGFPEILGPSLLLPLLFSWNYHQAISEGSGLREPQAPNLSPASPQALAPIRLPLGHERSRNRDHLPFPSLCPLFPQGTSTVGAQSRCLTPTHLQEKGTIVPPRPQAQSQGWTGRNQPGRGFRQQKLMTEDSGGPAEAPHGGQTGPPARSPKRCLREKQRPLSPLTSTLKSMLQPPEVISVIHISDQEIFFENQV